MPLAYMCYLLAFSLVHGINFACILLPFIKRIVISSDVSIFRDGGVLPVHVFQEPHLKFGRAACPGLGLE